MLNIDKLLGIDQKLSISGVRYPPPNELNNRKFIRFPWVFKRTASSPEKMGIYVVAGIIFLPTRVLDVPEQ